MTQLTDREVDFNKWRHEKGFGSHSALFLDRDGVILEQLPRKRNNELLDCHFQELSLAALKKSRALFDRHFVITNQAGIAYGKTTLKDQNEINAWMRERILEHDGYIEEVYMCPHSKDDGCACRKPGTALFKQAVTDFDIDVTRSYMVGDQLCDLEAAVAIGLNPVLVLSGHGLWSLCELIKNRPDYDTIWNAEVLVARDLYSFVEKDLLLPLRVYAETTSPPCREVARSNASIIQQSLQKYLETIRETVSLSRTPGL